MRNILDGSASRTSPLKVAVVIPSTRRPDAEGHPEAALRYLHPVLTSLGNVTALSVFTGLPNRSGGSYDIVHFNALRLFLSPKPGKYARSLSIASPLLLLRLWRRRYDVVIGFEYSSSTLWALLAARLSGATPMIFQEHVSHLSRSRLLLRRVLRRLARFGLANSPEAEIDLSARVGFDQEHVFRTPLLVPPPREFLTSMPFPLPHRQGATLFLAIGQLSERKNITSLLEASARLAARGYVFGVWIAGSGPLHDALSSRIRYLNLEAVVQLLGDVPYQAVGHLYAACDAFVHPAFTDYRAVAVLEAMSFGKPILLSTGDGSAGTLVRDGTEGLLFNPEDVDALAQCMARCINEPTILQTMGSASESAVHDLRPARAAMHLCSVISSTTQGCVS